MWWFGYTFKYNLYLGIICIALHYHFQNMSPSISIFYILLTVNVSSSFSFFIKLFLHEYVWFIWLFDPRLCLAACLSVTRGENIKLLLINWMLNSFHCFYYLCVCLYVDALLSVIRLFTCHLLLLLLSLACFHASDPLYSVPPPLTPSFTMSPLSGPGLSGQAPPGPPTRTGFRTNYQAPTWLVLSQCLSQWHVDCIHGNGCFFYIF